MNSGVSSNIQTELLYGDGKRKEWTQYPTLKEPYRSEYKVTTEDGYIIKDGKKYKPFDLESKNDVFFLMGKWIAKEWFGIHGNYWCYQITAIHDSRIYTSCEDCECEDPKTGERRNSVTAIELAVDFIFCDTGKPVAKEIQ